MHPSTQHTDVDHSGHLPLCADCPALPTFSICFLYNVTFYMYSCLSNISTTPHGASPHGFAKARQHVRSIFTLAFLCGSAQDACHQHTILPLASNDDVMDHDVILRKASLPSPGMFHGATPTDMADVVDLTNKFGQSFPLFNDGLQWAAVNAPHIASPALVPVQGESLGGEHAEFQPQEPPLATGERDHLHCAAGAAGARPQWSHAGQSATMMQHVQPRMIAPQMIPMQQWMSHHSVYHPHPPTYMNLHGPHSAPW